MQSFAGQTAIVTGATGAVGQAVAARLLDRGATVCLIGRTDEGLSSLVRDRAWPADRALTFAVDLSDEEAIGNFGVEVQRGHKRVHVLVHSAGAIAVDTIRDARIEDFDRQYRVNLRAPYLLTQLLLPQLIACQGQVAFVNSTAGLRGSRGSAQYAATKQGLRALADSLRDEVNEHGVRVVSIFLGRTASRMQAAVHARESRAYVPANLLQPDDVASMLVHALELPRTAEVTDISIRPLLKSY